MHPRSPGHYGFTLLEVLVSLTILGVGIMGVAAAVSVGAQRGSSGLRLGEAVATAQRELTLAITKPAGHFERTTGASGPLTWTVSYANKNHGLVAAAVEVQWREQGEARRYRLAQVFAPRR